MQVLKGSIFQAFFHSIILFTARLLNQKDRKKSDSETESKARRGGLPRNCLFRVLNVEEMAHQLQTVIDEVAVSKSKQPLIGLGPFFMLMSSSCDDTMIFFLFHWIEEK